MVQALPLSAVAEDYLVRDRIAVHDDELAALIESLRARGQQMPIEVVDLGGGRFGLISGWRRLAALRHLSTETGNAKFDTVQALLRRPGEASDAYIAMVEENEIRVGLSYYERARIVAKAVEQGVFASRKQALQRLFSTASRAKRSKIGSFLTIVEALDQVLRHPARLGERGGLALAYALEADPLLGARLVRHLSDHPAENAEGELQCLAEAVRGKSRDKATVANQTGAVVLLDGAVEPAEGVYLRTAGPSSALHLALSGPGVDATFRACLISWLAERG